MSADYDVIIVGGGPAGCVLAARLTEDPVRRVLLLEAGPDYGSDVAVWPPELHNPYDLPADSHNWGFINAANAAGYEVSLPRTRILGGSATVNGAVWNRCSALDYDHWAALGNPGWSFADLLPYFQKAESDPFGTPGLRGERGPVPVWRPPDEERNPIYEALIAVCDEHEIPLIDDFNGSPVQVPSISRAARNVAHPAGQRVRMNPALTYLAMARERENLTILPEALVDRVLFDGTQTVGVRTATGQEHRAGEVVLTAGAYASPAIMMRSGVGPAGQLGALGIAVVRDLAGVGENLMDHPNCGNFADYPVRSAHVDEMDLQFPFLIKARSSQVDEEIDLHLYSWVHYSEERDCWRFGMNASLQYARSAGRVRLKSTDPEALPDIDHRYFSDPADLEAICDGVALVQRLVHTAPLANMLDLDQPFGEAPPPDRDALRDWVRTDHHGTTYHPSTTCKMGPSSDPMAVVDQAGRVYGLTGLRVADASIMPFGPRGNLHFPIVAVAEKIADTMRAG